MYSICLRAWFDVHNKVFFLNLIQVQFLLFSSCQCGEREDPPGGRPGPSGSSLQSQHALQVERTAHPDFTSALQPIGQNARHCFPLQRTSIRPERIQYTDIC